MTRPGSVTYDAIDNWDRGELLRKAANGELVERGHRRWFVAEIESRIMFAANGKAVLVPDHSDPRHGILAELGTVDPHLIMKMMPDTKTPCVNLCKIDQVSGLCIGCARNLIEIAGWREFSDQERRQIMDDLPRRLRTDLRRNQQ